jgi:hypothetical protein
LRHRNVSACGSGETPRDESTGRGICAWRIWTLVRTHVHLVSPFSFFFGEMKNLSTCLETMS